MFLPLRGFALNVMPEVTFRSRTGFGIKILYRAVGRNIVTSADDHVFPLRFGSLVINGGERGTLVKGKGNYSF